MSYLDVARWVSTGGASGEVAVGTVAQTGFKGGLSVSFYLF